MARYCAEELRFFRSLRALSEMRPPGSPRLQFFGYDVDVRPGGAYADIDALLIPYAAKLNVQELKQRLRRVEGETTDDEVQRLLRVRNYITQNRAALQEEADPATLREMESALRCLTESLAFTRLANANPSTPAIIEAFRRREETMFWQMDEALENPGQMILMGHNSHLTRDDSQFSDVVTMPSWKWPRIGTYLSRKVPVLAIWMLYGAGVHSDLQLCAGGDCPVAETEVGHHLAGLGCDFLLPTNADSFLDRPREYPINGQVARGRLSRAADVIFFVRRVSVLQPD